MAGCARNRAARAPVPPPPSSRAGLYVEQGVASWYGPPFDGRKAADGEIFDMNTLVAAHRTLPFGSIVRVTNLRNGRQIDVRIIDRGPFVRGRIIDLSLAAARAIDMELAGIAPVRLQIMTAPASLAGDFSVQVGAFQMRENAERLRVQFSRYPVYVQDYDAPTGHFYRVRVGRLPNQQDAQRLADQFASDYGLQTFVVRLDEVK